MPYIPPARRRGAAFTPASPGELSYAITSLVAGYVRRQGGVSYQTINDVMGVLEGVKAEFYRRVAAQYEDKKMALNGDVYPLEQTQ